MSAASPRYFDRRASGYLAASERQPWKMVRAGEWRALRSALRLAPGQNVLDLGCGPGHYSLRMRAVADIRLHGVDHSAAMMHAYRAQGFEGTHCRAEDFVSPRRFDRVLLAGLLEFVEDPEEVFRPLSRLLAESGRAVCLVPKPGLIGAIYGSVHALASCPTRLRDPELYSRIAERHGLKILERTSATFMGIVLVFGFA